MNEASQALVNLLTALGYEPTRVSDVQITNAAFGWEVAVTHEVNDGTTVLKRREWHALP